jgi:hypothetical protein
MSWKSYFLTSVAVAATVVSVAAMSGPAFARIQTSELAIIDETAVSGVQHGLRLAQLAPRQVPNVRPQPNTHPPTKPGISGGKGGGKGKGGSTGKTPQVPKGGKVGNKGGKG